MSFIYKWAPRTLLARFLLIIITPTIIGQMLAVFLFYDRHWYNVSYHTGSLIADEMSLIVDRFQNDDIEMQGLLREFFSFSYEFYPNAHLSGTQGRLGEELEIFKSIVSTRIEQKNIIKLKEGKIKIDFQLENGILSITFPAKPLINPTTYIFVLWIAFLTLLLLSISLIFSKNQIKSILELAKAADEFGHGKNLNATYKPTGAKEIRLAGLAFIRMKERIERQINKRTQMLAMISHDLRTPLTRMKLQIDMMNDGEEKEGLKQDVRSMEQMIATYLDFARGEGGEEFQKTNIYLWLKNILETKWHQANIELIGTDNIFANIKPYALQRAIFNIISNAVKYSTKIKISVYSSTKNIIIEIEDNGTGINDEEKQEVFKPFYRSDKSRNLDKSGNVGLGLAIVKEIISSHFGIISLEDGKILGGLLVRISLPVIETE